MKRTAPIWFAGLLSLMGTSCFAQTWTYQGSQICFQSGPGNSMCFSQGTFASTAADLSQGSVSGQSYEQSFRPQPNPEGAAIGALVGTLIATWVNHHRMVKAEEKALKEELLSNLDAEIEIMRETKREDEDTADQAALLKTLDRSRSQLWATLEVQYREKVLPLHDRLIQLKTEYRENVDKNFKARKVLDYALNDKKAGEKMLYENTLKLAAFSDVVNQFCRVLLGYYQNQSLPRPVRYVTPAQRAQTVFG